MLTSPTGLRRSGAVTIYWGKRTKKKYFANVISAVPDVNDFLSFLHMRLGPDGRPVTYKLGEPQEIEIGLWRLPWTDFEEPTGAMGPRDGSWERAWHGTKLEALYSIMFHGQLCASHMEGSHRFFPNKPGVYCHGDHTQDKAASYARFVSLTQRSFLERDLGVACGQVRPCAAVEVFKRPVGSDGEELPPCGALGARSEHHRHGEELASCSTLDPRARSEPDQAAVRSRWVVF